MSMVVIDPSDTDEVEQLHSDLAVACGQLNAATAQLVDVVATASMSGVWQVEGIRSPQQWVAWQCGLSPQHARVVCEAAMRVSEFPVTFDAFRRGELSFDQVAPITRRAPGWADREACELAKVLTARQLSSALSKYVFPDEPPDDPTTDTVDPAADSSTNDTDDHDADQDTVDHDADTGTADASDAESGEGGDQPADSGAETRQAGTPDVMERLWLHPNEDGTWQLGGFLDADHGELLNQALTEARDHLFQHGQPTVNWVDALIEMCNRSLDTIDDNARRDRYRIYLHLEHPHPGPGPCRGATITGLRTTTPTPATGTADENPPPGPPAAHDEHSPPGPHATAGEHAPRPPAAAIHDPPGTANDPPPPLQPLPPQRPDDVLGLFGPLGHRLPDELRRYLTCDTKITPVWEHDGIPVSVGRSQRTVPDRTRRLIVHRDGGCRVPGCTHNRWLDIHHIQRWEDAGPTDTHNLVCLCTYHHRQHHLGKLGITGNADDPDGLIFTNLRGQRMHGHITPTPHNGPLPEPAGTYIHPIGEAFRDDDLWFNPPLHLRPHYNRTACRWNRGPARPAPGAASGAPRRTTARRRHR